MKIKIEAILKEIKLWLSAYLELIPKRYEPKEPPVQEQMTRAKLVFGELVAILMASDMVEGKVGPGPDEGGSHEGGPGPGSRASSEAKPTLAELQRQYLDRHFQLLEEKVLPVERQKAEALRDISSTLDRLITSLEGKLDRLTKTVNMIE